MKMGLNQVLTPACPVGSGLLPSQKVCPALRVVAAEGKDKIVPRR